MDNSQANILEKKKKKNQQPTTISIPSKIKYIWKIKTAFGSDFNTFITDKEYIYGKLTFHPNYLCQRGYINRADK